MKSEKIVYFVIIYVSKFC